MNHFFKHFTGVVASLAISCGALMPLATQAAFYSDAIESLEYYDSILEIWQDFEDMDDGNELEGPVGFRVWIPDYGDCSGSSPYTLSFDVAGPNVNGLGPAEPVLTVPGGAPGYVTWEFDPDDYFADSYEITNLALKCQAGEDAFNGINNGIDFYLVGHAPAGTIASLLLLLGWVF